MRSGHRAAERLKGHTSTAKRGASASPAEHTDFKSETNLSRSLNIDARINPINRLTDLLCVVFFNLI